MKKIARKFVFQNTRKFTFTRRNFQQEDNEDFVSEASYYLQKAKSEHEKQNYKDCIKSCMESLKYSKKSIVAEDTYWVLFQAYLESGEFSNCIPVLNEAILNFPENFEFQLSKANTLLKLEKIYESKEIIESIIEKNPKFPTVRMSLGLCYLKLRNYILAIENFQKGIENDPDFEPILSRMYLAQCHKAIGNKGNYEFYIEECKKMNLQETEYFLKKLNKEN